MFRLERSCLARDQQQSLNVTKAVKREMIDSLDKENNPPRPPVTQELPPTRALPYAYQYLCQPQVYQDFFASSSTLPGS